MDTVGEVQGGSDQSDTGGTAYIEPYFAAFICPASAGERDTDQLLVALAGALVDTDDAYLPGAGTGSDGEPGGGAVTYGVRSGSYFPIMPTLLNSQRTYWSEHYSEYSVSAP